MRIAFRASLLLTLTAMVLMLASPALADRAAEKEQNPWDEDGLSGGPAGGDGGPAVVPEPGTMVLLGLGLAALGAAHRRRHKKS